MRGIAELKVAPKQKLSCRLHASLALGAALRLEHLTLEEIITHATSEISQTMIICRLLAYSHFQKGFKSEKS